MDQCWGHRRRHRVRQLLVQALGVRHQVRGHRRHRAGPPAELVQRRKRRRIDRDLVEGYVVQGRQRLGGPQHPGRCQRRRHLGIVEHRLQGLATDQLHREPRRLALVGGDDGGHGHTGGRQRVHDAGLAQHVVPTDRLLARWHRLHHQRTLAGLDPIGQARVAAGQPREESHLHVRPLTAQRRRDALAQPALVDLGAHDRGSRGRPRTRSAMMLCWISSVPPAMR